MLVVDFRAYARKMPVKKTIENLRRYDNIFGTLTKLASDYARIDIIFDLYITYSIKETKRNKKCRGRNDHKCI